MSDFLMSLICGLAVVAACVISDEPRQIPKHNTHMEAHR